MIIRTIGFLSVSVFLMACQTKQRKEDNFMAGASQETAGGDVAKTEDDPTSLPESIVFRLTGGDETNSSQAKVTYECSDGYDEQSTLDLNAEGESQLANYDGSTDCKVVLREFTVGGNVYQFSETDTSFSHDIGEIGTYANANSEYSVMVVAQLPGSEVHYQYSTFADEEKVEDQTEQDDPHQSPSQN